MSEERKAEARVWFENGRIVHAEATDPDLALPDVLLAKGELSLESYYAVQEQLRHALAMGATLFAGLPGPARASGTEYVAVSGRTYAGAHAADCNGTSHKTDGINDHSEVSDAFELAGDGGTVHFC